MEARKISSRKIAYVVVALLILCGCFLGYAKATEVPKKQVDILFLGDSLIGQYRDETSIPYLVGELLGMSSYNGAFGGTSLSKLNTEKNKAYQKDGLTLISLARAIAYDDFGAQQATAVRESATEHFPQVVDELEQLDFESLEYLLIEFGTNDYYAGVPIENPEDSYEEYTFKGALRSSLEILRKYLPDLQIILISPTYNWYVNTGQNCENLEFGGGYLEDYVTAIADIAEEYGVGYLDLYHDFYPTGDNSLWEIYTLDGVHPNEDGREKIAQKIVEYIESN